MYETAQFRSSGGIFFSAVALGIVLAGTPDQAAGAAGDCGQPTSAGAGPTATDALYVLNVAVGFGSCELCVCDTDGSGTTTATDALKTLIRAVGVSVELACPPCEPLSLCDGLVLGAATGEPFDRIDIGDVPDSNNSVWAVVTPSTGDDALAAVRLDDEGTDLLMVPLHPSGNLDGGTVAVAITDGVEVCPIGSITILPLPTAPADTSENALGAFLALLNAAASDFGLTGAELATTPLDELPSQLIPLALAQIVLAGPDNENSLAALLAGTAPDADGGLDIDLVNRAFAKIGLEAALQQRLADRVPIVPAASVARRAHDVAEAHLGAGCGPLEPADFEINTAEELSVYMLAGLAARNGQTDIGAGVVKDGLSMLFTLIGLANTPAGAAGGAALFAWNLHEEAAGSLYPSVLTNIEFEVENDGRIPEDRMDGGGGALAPFPEWSDPQLYATNQGMELTRTSVELLLTAINFIPVPGGLSGNLLKAGALEDANNALDDLGEQDCWTIPPTPWGPIGEARDPKYVEPIFFGSSVEQVLFEFFQPITLGDTQLRVRTTDAFSGPVISEEKEIRVVRKEVSLERQEINVEPGDPVEVIATMIDSYQPAKVEWQYPGFVVNPVVEQIADDTHKLSFTSPADRTLYPFEVKAFSTSIALDPQTPAREATATIEAGAGVMITPRDGCVPNGSKLDLVATVTGLAESEDDSVSWVLLGEGDLVPGSENTAEYFAPETGSGEVVIAATLDIDDEVSDEISVLYGSCDVNLDLGWYAGSSTDDPDLPADIDQMKSAYYSQPLFPADGDLLVPPESWWNGRSRTVSTQNGSSYLHTVYDDEGAPHELVLTSASQIDAEMTSLGGGAAELSMTWSTTAECQAIPNSVNGIACSNATAELDWNPVIWIEVSEPGTYDAQFTLSCSSSEPGGKQFLGAHTHLSRHVGSEAQPNGFPNGGTNDPLYINPFNPFDAPPPSSDDSLLFFDPDFICEPGTPIVVQKTFQLKGPTNPPEPDIIALVILVKALMISPFDPYTQTTGTVGSHALSGTIHSSVMIARTDP